jgi:hypothetical protein
MNTSSERLPRPKPRRATSVIAAHPITTHPIETFKPAGSSDEYIITWLRHACDVHQVGCTGYGPDVGVPR